MDDKHPIMHMAMVILGWFATIKLADVQVFVAIFSGLLVATYTGLRIYYLVKEKKDNE